MGMGGWTGNQARCSHFGQGTLRPGDCLGHPLATRVPRVEGRGGAGLWSVCAVGEREEELKGTHHSSKSSRCPFHLLLWLFAVLDMGRWARLKSRQRKQCSCESRIKIRIMVNRDQGNFFLLEWGDKGHQCEFGGKQELEKGSGALEEVKWPIGRSLGQRPKWQDLGSAGLMGVAVQMEFGIQKSPHPCKALYCLMTLQLQQVGLCPGFQIE